ncbi:hypothetical protein FPV67DRAFT_1443249 [Lyophyllum atratum]|nr:hypothetical protein FPV67DRAFT_1443249 [Lyophyllum atratum]
MSVSCTSSPTLTSTTQITTQTFTTSTTSSVTTLPPTTSVTSTVAPCPSAPSGAAATCVPSTTFSTITIPGATQTVQVPITLPVDITTTAIATLWGTSCTTINTNPNPPPSDTNPPAPPPSNTPTSSLTTTPTNGSPTVQTVTETSTQPVNTIVANDKDGNGANMAPIIGGAVGGFFGLLAVVALIWFILKRRRRWDDIFDKEDDDIIAAGARRPGRFSLDVDTEPKPYQYGLVGQALAPSAVSPPTSPAMRPSTGKGAPNIHHARSSSLTPLNVPMTVSTPLASATTISSRPSTAGSQQHLFPQTQQGYPPQLPLLSHQQQQQQQSRPTNTLTHSYTHSSGSGSFTSPPVSLSNWSGGPGPGYNAGVMMGMSMGAPSVTSEEHMYANRSGSPTSIQETQVRRLQVANAVNLSPASETFEYGESSSSAAAAAASAVQRDGKGRFVRTSAGAPVVHQDGGRVQRELEVATAGASSVASSGAPGPSGVSPPAYEE